MMRRLAGRVPGSALDATTRHLPSKRVCHRLQPGRTLRATPGQLIADAARPWRQNLPAWRASVVPKTPILPPARLCWHRQDELSR